ncbi:hypothetical protein Landi51_04646 [Colletotrichum acutatum]
MTASTLSASSSTHTLAHPLRLPLPYSASLTQMPYEGTADGSRHKGKILPDAQATLLFLSRASHLFPPSQNFGLLTLPHIRTASARAYLSLALSVP